MNEEGLRVRCSRLWAICVAFACGIFGGGCAITMLVFAIIGIISPDDANGTDISGDVVTLCGGIVILGFVIFAMCCTIKTLSARGRGSSGISILFAASRSYYMGNSKARRRSLSTIGNRISIRSSAS